MDEPDLNFDIDALFDHLTDNLDHNPDDEQDWHFILRSDDLQKLELVAEEMSADFSVRLYENVEEVDADGNAELGDPMLAIIRTAALTADEVKEIAAQVQTIADQRGLSYEGVDCYEPFDEEEIFGWLAPDDAGWRLRHMTDCGLEDDAAMPWAFLVLAPSLESLSLVGGALDTAGFADHVDFAEPDEDGNFGLCVFVAGRNNEIELYQAAEKIEAVVDKHDGSLAGIQFYDREDFESEPLES